MISITLLFCFCFIVSPLLSASPRSLLNPRTPTGLNASLLRSRKRNHFQETQTANAGGGGEKWTGCRTHLGLNGVRQRKHLLQAVSDLTRLPKLSLLSTARRGGAEPFFSPSFLSPLALTLLETENGLPSLQLLQRQTICPGRQGANATVLPGQVRPPPRGVRQRSAFSGTADAPQGSSRSR